MVFKKSFSRFFISNKSKFVPEKVFLRGVLLHYFNMKKTAAESHRILVDVYGEHAPTEQTCQKWCTIQKCWFWLGRRRMSRAAENIWRCRIEGHTWRRSMPNARINCRSSWPLDSFQTFKSHGSKEIRYHTNWSQETLRCDFWHANCCSQGRKEKLFCSALSLAMKSAFITIRTQSQIFMTRSWCCVYGGTSFMWSAGSC